MKLFLLKQDIVNDYDTYDSCVVAAENEEEARKIHPSEFVTHERNGHWYGTYSDKSGEYSTGDDNWVSFQT